MLNAAWSILHNETIPLTIFDTDISVTGDVYIPEIINGNIFGITGSGVNNPYDMAVDLDGNVYVTGESQLNGYIDFATLKYNTNLIT